MTADFITPEDAEPTGPLDLTRITQMAEMLVEYALAIESTEADLAQMKARQRELSEETLPNAMREVGLTELTLASGFRVKVVPDVQCGISEERRLAAHAWLKAKGFGGLIKTQLIAEFGRGEEKEAARISALLAEQGHPADVQERVHPQTLKAFVKEQLVAGLDIPIEPFALRPYDKTTVVAPKVKK